MSSRLKEVYKNEIVDAMMKKFNYKNIMEVPKLEKVVINMGVGEAKENAKVLETAVKDLETIAGQKAVLTKAKKSIRGKLQNQRGHGHRVQSDLKRRADVRVCGPSDQPVPAPCT